MLDRKCVLSDYGYRMVKAFRIFIGKLMVNHYWMAFVFGDGNCIWDIIWF